MASINSYLMVVRVVGVEESGQLFGSLLFLEEKEKEKY